jgi:hypothetical protein
VAVSPDGKSIAVGDFPGTVMLLESAPPRAGYQPRLDATEARELVDRLHNELRSYDKVIDTIRTDSEMRDKVRQYAIQIATSRSRSEQRTRP